MGLRMQWSVVYHSPWDATPEAYLECGIVAPGRSRRLARMEDDTRAFKAYLGVQHFDPTRYGLPGQAQTRFFLSLFLRGRIVTLRTYPTLDAARAALDNFHAGLAPA